MLRNIVQRNIVQRNIVQSNIMLRDIVQRNIMERNNIQKNTMQRNIVQREGKGKEGSAQEAVLPLRLSIGGPSFSSAHYNTLEAQRTKQHILAGEHSTQQSIISTVRCSIPTTTRRFPSDLPPVELSALYHYMVI